MTLFCTAVTGIILLFMTLAGLLAFKNLLDTNDRTSYEKDVDSVLAYLENEEVIDYEKISAAANPRFYTINLYENKICYSYDPEKEKQELMEEICRKAKEIYGFDVSALSAAKGISKLLEFSMKYKGTDHLVTFAAVPHQFGTFCTVISYSRETLKRQFLYLYVVFAVIDGAALLLLFLFSWVYTGKMLYPIEKNRAQQMQFVAAASHELRSPLAVMLSCLTAAQKAEPEEAARFTETIQTEGKRMSRLIDDMLQLAGADACSWDLMPAPVPPDTLLLETYEKYEYLAREKGLTLHIRLPEEECPPVLCDEERIAQVLSILMDNALSYTPAPGSITLSLSFTSGHVSLSVADNGPGIPDSSKKQVFQRFFRQDKAHTSKDHFGLGLSIAREIVRIHRGRLVLSDTPGGGATFTIILRTAPA